MFNLPAFTPLRGHVIIAFTAEQIKTFNKVGSLFIEERFHPEQWSIEEAVVVAVSETQGKLKPGDSVLVDYGIFVAGRSKRMDQERIRSSENRFVYSNSEYYLYYAYDDQHPHNSSEIFATISDEGKATAFGSLVLLYPFEDKEALVDVVANISDLQQQYPGASWALVYNSTQPEIRDGDLLLCEKGLSPVIKFRGTELQYIWLPYIIGKADKSAPLNVSLM